MLLVFFFFLFPERTLFCFKDEKDEGVVVPLEKKSVKELATEHLLAAQEAAETSPRKADLEHGALPLSPVVKVPVVAPAKGRGRGAGRGVAKPPGQ